jgi:tetratricopeptide (TPR) repeat protein
MYTDLSLLRRTRMHARVAEAIRQRHPDDLTALAHHYARAASSETAWLAVQYGVAAAHLAERRYASDVEVALFSQALTAFDRVPAGTGPADRDQFRIDLMGQLLRAQVRAGATVAARQTRDHAVELAERAGRDDLLIAAFTAWSVPTPWLMHTYGWFDDRAIGGLTSLLARADLDGVTRCRLLAALAAELEGSDDPVAAEVSKEAVELARVAGDPALLALALTARARVTTPDREPHVWAELGVEIERIAAEHDLPAYRWYAAHMAGRVAAARNDVAALREHSARSLAIARAFQMGDPESVALCTPAVFAQLGGRYAEAASLFREAADQMARLGSPHAAAFRAQVLATLLVDQHRYAEILTLVRAAAARLPRRGGRRRAVARAPRRAGPGERSAPRHRGCAGLSLRHLRHHPWSGDRRARRRGRGTGADRGPDALRDQVAGIASTVIAARPVAHTLGELYELLGRMDEAREHYARAVEIAKIWGAPVWQAEAEAALQAVNK